MDRLGFGVSNSIIGLRRASTSSFHSFQDVYDYSMQMKANTNELSPDGYCMIHLREPTTYNENICSQMIPLSRLVLDSGEPTYTQNEFKLISKGTLAVNPYASSAMNPLLASALAVNPYATSAATCGVNPLGATSGAFLGSHTDLGARLRGLSSTAFPLSSLATIRQSSFGLNPSFGGCHPSSAWNTASWNAPAWNTASWNAPAWNVAGMMPSAWNAPMGKMACI